MVLCLKTGGPLYKGKGERNECANYRHVSGLNVVGKIYSGIIVNRVCRVAESLIDNEQGGYQIRAGVCRIYLNPTLKQIGKKA